MPGVGRGAVLKSLLNTTGEDVDPPSSSCGYLAPFGRGTSLMTPSQFMKSTSSTISKNVSSAGNSSNKASDAIQSSPQDSKSDEGNSKKRFELTLTENLTLPESDSDESDLAEEPNILNTDEKEVLTDENIVSNVESDQILSIMTKMEVPSLEVDDKESSIHTEKREIKTLGMKDPDCSDNIPVINATSENIFIIPDQKSKHMVEQKTSQHTQKVSNPSESKEQTEERSEDEKWKLYQVERKIDKIIKSISLENLGDMFQELEYLIEDRPLSSRYINCSEVKLLLDAIMKNAVQNAEFLPLAPCLIKMVSEHQPIEFKQYFPEICDAKCQECVSLSASDEYLNKNGQQFCKLLGHLLAMPRQRGLILFNIMSTIVNEYVEQWTCPEGSESAKDGLQTYRLAVEATAVKCLLLEITQKMLSCDREVEIEMEKFVWLMRESVLNVDVPKKVREIYLDGLIEVQTTSPDVSSATASATGFLGANSQSESESDIYFDIDTGNEDDELKGDDRYCAENVKSDELKSETDDSVHAPKENDNVDFRYLQNPPIDTIAMAPRIENAYDSSGTVPKFHSSGFGKMAMTFGNKFHLENISRSEEHNDDDVIIEDEDNLRNTLHDMNIISRINITNSGKGADDAKLSNPESIFICDKAVSKNQNNNPFISNSLPKKKLPIGRGRGLARLPDFCGSGFLEKPVANVNPIGYSSSEATSKSHNPDNSFVSSGESSNIGRGNETMRHQRRSGANEPNRSEGMPNKDSKPEYFNEQRTAFFRNDTRSDNYNRRRGSGPSNDIRTDSFQNHRGGGPGGRGNHANKNSFNSPQSNPNWRDKNRRFKNENQKARKTNFRPVYHKRNTNIRDDQPDVTNPVDPMLMSQSKDGTELEKFYQPNGRLDYRVKTSQKQEFGSVRPQTCLRCNSVNHLAEECTVNNIFF